MNPVATPHSVPVDAPLVRVSGVCHGYGGAPVLHELDLEVCPGVLGVLGNNGAGKSTLLKLLSGFVAPDEGTVEIVGIHATREPDRVRQNTAYLPEHGEVDGRLTAGEFLEFVACIRGETEPERVVREGLERFGVSRYQHTQYRALSLGTQRKMALISAWFGTPRVVVLDEPTTGLDLAGIGVLEGIAAAHGQGGGAVILSSHDMGFVERACDRIVVLCDGTPCWQGTPAALVAETAKGDLHAAVLYIAGSGNGPSAPATAAP